MTLNVWFWVIYLISIFFAWWVTYDAAQPWYRRAGGYTVLWILVGILGWAVFGPAVK